MRPMPRQTESPDYGIIALCFSSIVTSADAYRETKQKDIAGRCSAPHESFAGRGSRLCLGLSGREKKKSTMSARALPRRFSGDFREVFKGYPDSVRLIPLPDYNLHNFNPEVA
jgi:hypothetical protein